MPNPKKKVVKRKIYSELQPFASRMKYLREKAGKSKEEFADEIDISRTLYADYEKGANITAINLLKIVHGFGMTLNEFFNEDFD